jgi:transcriptional regulator with PAS, ATPase and Fis domain
MYILLQNRKLNLKTRTMKSERETKKMALLKTDKRRKYQFPGNARSLSNRLLKIVHPTCSYRGCERTAVAAECTHAKTTVGEQRWRKCAA